MAYTYLLKDKETHITKVKCDGCRSSQKVRLPVSVKELSTWLLEFEADHQFCAVRPVQCCQHLNEKNVSCAHPGNSTQECKREACPLL